MIYVMSDMLIKRERGKYEENKDGRESNYILLNFNNHSIF